MSYTKTTWSENDIITADKMNNIEEGIDSFVYELDASKYTTEMGSDELKIIIDEETFIDIKNSLILIVTNIANSLNKVYFIRSTDLEEGQCPLYICMLDGSSFNLASLIGIENEYYIDIITIRNNN